MMLKKQGGCWAETCKVCAWPKQRETLEDEICHKYLFSMGSFDGRDLQGLRLAEAGGNLVGLKLSAFSKNNYVILAFTRISRVTNI